MCEAGMKPSLLPVHQTNSLGFLGNPKTFVIKFLQHLCKRHRQVNLQAVAEIGSGQWVAKYITICTGTIGDISHM